MPRVLITGASGFVGRHLAHACAAAGDEVIGLSRDGLMPEGCGQGVEVDLREDGPLRAAVAQARPEVVYHLAVLSSVGRSWEEPARTIRDNVTTAVNMLEALRHEAAGARVVWVSSGEVYGAPDELPVAEDAPLQPANPYAVSKTTGDLLAGVYQEAHGLDLVRARPFNHSGPGQLPVFIVSSLARQAAEARLAGGPALRIVTGNPDTRRDFTDVRDVVRAHRLLAGLSGPGVYNIATGRSVSAADQVDLVRELIAPIEVEHEIDPARVRAHEVMDLRGSPERITAATGWQPEIPLRQTMADTIAWWERNSPVRPARRADRSKAPARRATLTVAARLAQLVEHLICNQGVGGSSPPAGLGIQQIVSPICPDVRVGASDRRDLKSDLVRHFARAIRNPKWLVRGLREPEAGVGHGDDMVRVTGADHAVGCAPRLGGGQYMPVAFDPSNPPAQNQDEQSKTAVARLLSVGARGAERVAHAAGVDAAVEEAVEEAIVRALKSPAVRRAIDRAVEDQAFASDLRAEEISRVLRQVLASEAAAQAWKEVLASDQAQMLVERIAEAPEVRAAITAQGAGLVTDIGVRLTRLTESLDDSVERIVRHSAPDSETDQAGLVTRLAAAGVDFGLAFLVYALASSMASTLVPVTSSGKTSIVLIIVLSALGAAATLSVIVAFWALVGQTPGMRFLSIRIVRGDSHEIGLRCAVRRLIGVALALIPAGLGILAIARNRERRGWHDRIAGTEVIYDRIRRTAPHSRERNAGESTRRRAD